jgi:signal transduction histidine kinase
MAASSSGTPAAVDVPALSSALRPAQAARESDQLRSARLRALHEAALTIASPVPGDPASVAELLSGIVKHAVGALDGRDGRIVLAEHVAWCPLVPGADASAGLVLLDHAGLLHRAPQRPHGITSYVLQHGEPVLVSDTQAPSAFGPYPQLAAAGIQSFVVIPLRARDRILGVLSVTFNQLRELQAEDREALELFAAHAAAALERVCLAAERQDALRDLAKREAEAAALRQLDRLKSNLLLMLSHELRTPLTLIHGYAQFLHSRAHSLDPEAIQSMTARIHAGSSQLARLVDGMLDFVRIEHGDVAVRPQRLDLVPLVQSVVASFRPQPGNERLVCHVPTSLPVYADRARIAQVISNLVDNAITYAPEGPIIVRATASGGVARVEVQDQGPGLTLEDEPRVWESLYRGAGVAGLNVAPGGGLGLAVVKSLVEAHGGQVGVASAPAHGACFWFELPLTPLPPPPAA